MLSDLRQPHILSTVIDESEVTVEAQSDDTVTVFAVITSTQGPANTIREYYDSNTIVATYGTPDYRVHGHQYINLLNAVKNGAKALVMRAVPIDDRDNPDIAAGSLSNVFLDIQTKHISTTTTAKKVDLVSANGVTLTADSSNVGQSTISIAHADKPVSTTDLEKMVPGDTVFFYEDVTGHETSASSNAEVELMYYAESDMFSTIGLSIGDDVIVKLAAGDEAAKISTSNGIDGITRFSILLDNCNDISTTESTLITKNGVVIGYANSIVAVGKVTTFLDDIVVTSEVDYAPGASDVTVVINEQETKKVICSISGAADIAAAIVLINAESMVQFGQDIASINVDNNARIDFTNAAINADLGMGTVSSVSVAFTDDLIFDSAVEASPRLISDTDTFNITNLEYDSKVYVGGTVTINSAGAVTAGAEFSVFPNKAIYNTEFYIYGTGVATATAQEVTAKVETSVATTIVDLTETSAATFNIISFTSDPVDTSLAKGKIFYDSASYGELVEVRPVIINKRVGTVNELKSFMSNPYSDPLLGTTEDGFTRHIIFGVSRGMSLAENVYGLRFTGSTKYDEDADGFRIYNLEVTETINGVVKVIGSPYVVSFDTAAKDSYGVKIGIKSILDTYDGTLDVYTSDDNYELLLEDLDAAANTAGVEIDPGYYDFLFGQERVSTEKTVMEQSYINIVNTPFTNGTYVEDIGGNTSFPLYKESRLVEISYAIEDGEIVESYACAARLAQGSSGSLDGLDINGNVLTSSERIALVDSLLVNAYNGTLFPEIYNKKAYPIDVIFDGKLSNTVKIAIADFVKHPSRGDIFFYADLGTSPNYLTTLNTRKGELASISDISVGFFGQEYIVYDQYTKTYMQTSLVHALAKKLAENDTNPKLGPQTPLAGKYFRLYGYEEDSLSFNPTVDQREEFVINRINYAEKDTKSTATMMTQLTSQRKTSALSDINNVRVLKKMIVKAENLAREYQYDKYSNILTTFKSDLDDMINEYIGDGSIDYAKVVVSASDYERRLKQVRISIRVKFTDRIHTFLFNWTVTL